MHPHQPRGLLEHPADFEQAHRRQSSGIGSHIHRLAKYDVSE
jgi:hypothetical protein